MDPSDDVLLENLSKQHEKQPKNKTLTKAIGKSDLSFISELLVSDTRLEEVSALSKYHKSKLLQLLVEFLDQPLRLEAIQCMYEIMTDVGSIDSFSRSLAERSSGFNKLVMLKGKIDYLRYLQKAKSSGETEQAEIEYTEK